MGPTLNYSLSIPGYGTVPYGLYPDSYSVKFANSMLGQQNSSEAKQKWIIRWQDVPAVAKYVRTANTIGGYILGVNPIIGGITTGVGTVGSGVFSYLYCDNAEIKPYAEGELPLGAAAEWEFADVMLEFKPINIQNDTNRTDSFSTVTKTLPLTGSNILLGSNNPPVPDPVLILTYTRWSVTFHNTTSPPSIATINGFAGQTNSETISIPLYGSVDPHYVICLGCGGAEEDHTVEGILQTSITIDFLISPIDVNMFYDVTAGGANVMDNFVTPSSGPTSYKPTDFSSLGV